MIFARRYFRNWSDYLLACYGKKHELMIKDGSKVFIRDPKDADILKSIWFYNEYGLDPKKDYATIVDVGAHIGFFSLFARMNYPNAKIYSYEPLGANFESLLKNTQGRNITCVNNAVSGIRGTVKLYKHERHTASSLELVSKDFDAVESVTLGDIISDVGPIDLLKLDCEGAEYEILKSDLSQIREIIMEYHNINGLDHSTLIKTLEDGGFIVQVLPVNEKLGQIRAISNRFKRKA